LIDGIKIFYRIHDFEQWKSTVKIDLFTPTDLETGETKGKTREINGTIQQTITHRGNLDTFRIAIKETAKEYVRAERIVSHLLILDGSLHKNHFNGSNYLPFTWDNLQSQIEYLETSLQLTGPYTEIVNLEIGLNINLPFAVFPYLRKNLLVYKCTPFNRYNPDRNGVCLGFVCPLTQYQVKVYDKGKLFELPYNLMRFELRYLKMQPLKERGIVILSDLKDLEKVNALKDLLLSAWENVLLSDNTINLSNPAINPKDRELLKLANNPKYWETLKEENKRRFNYHRSKYRQLIAKHGMGYHSIIREQINNEWNRLFVNPKTPELYNLTVKVKGNNVQSLGLPNPRFCISCGRDISHQDKRSSFCSPKSVGEVAAHRCRNKDSNRRNNLKGKIERLKRRGLLFDITPYLNNQFNSSFGG
jgi:hypothetical protein